MNLRPDELECLKEAFRLSFQAMQLQTSLPKIEGVQSADTDSIRWNSLYLKNSGDEHKFYLYVIDPPHAEPRYAEEGRVDTIVNVTDSSGPWWEELRRQLPRIRSELQKCVNRGLQIKERKEYNKKVDAEYKRETELARARAAFGEKHTIYKREKLSLEELENPHGLSDLERELQEIKNQQRKIEHEISCTSGKLGYINARSNPKYKYSSWVLWTGALAVISVFMTQLGNYQGLYVTVPIFLICLLWPLLKKSIDSAEASSSFNHLSQIKTDLEQRKKQLEFRICKACGCTPASEQ